jgi:hypothetical protein
MGIGLTLLGIYALLKATDPIDNNFKHRAKHNPPKLVLVKPDPNTGIDSHAAKVINDVLKNQVHAIGVDRALVTSINRAQGATVANAPKYEKLRMKDARNYAAKLATSLRLAAALRSEAATTFRNIGAVHTFTEDEAYEIRSVILDNGLPSEIDEIFSRYCSDADEKNTILRRHVSQMSDLHQFEVTFPDVLSKPELDDAEKKVASALEEFSESTHLSV